MKKSEKMLDKAMNQQQTSEKMKPLKNLKNIGLFEIECDTEFHIFEITHNKEYIAVGSTCNAGFSTDSYMKKDDCFSLDEQLQYVYEVLHEALINDEEITGEII